ncbi:MAG: sensor domain-containing diguanylate cyclase [Marinomonas sp.]
MTQPNNDCYTKEFEQHLNFSPVPVVVFDVKTNQAQFINHAFQQSLEFALEDIPNLPSCSTKFFAVPHFQQEILEPWFTQNQDKELGNTSCLETSIYNKSGCIRKVRLFYKQCGSKRIVYIRDITDHWIAEQRLKVRNETLEMVAKSSSLQEILTIIVQQIEQESPPSLCCILLFDKQSQCLLLGASPHLPDFYNAAIHGIRIGEHMGSCGAAAYLGKRVIVENIDTHPNWQGLTDLTQKAKLHSCWSEPIMASDGQLLGTFAIYNAPSSTPSLKDIEQIQFASNLASIAIENHNTHQELEYRAHYDFLTGLANRRYFFERATTILQQAIALEKTCALLMMDVDHFKKVNDIYGHDLGDIVLQHLAKISLKNLPEEAIMGRIGGEEFAILLPDTNRVSALQAAEILREALSTDTLSDHESHAIHFTVSLGVSFSSGQHCDTDMLLREADKALYKAKQTGRNRVCLFNGC